MSKTFSYATILHAVGQVLDQIGVKAISIQEEEQGLCVEGLAGNSQVQIYYTVADLYTLLGEPENQEEEPMVTPNTGVLYRFLAEHNRELVGTTF